MKQLKEPRATSDALDEWLATAHRLGLQPHAAATCVLAGWADLVIRWRQRAQLTALRQAGAVISELMTPALYAAAVAPLGPGTVAVDLGCGSGATAVSLRSAADGADWRLIDRATAKVVFCRHAISSLGLDRMEAGAPSPGAPGTRADVVLCRGTPRTEEMSRLADAYCADGGSVVSWSPEPTDRTGEVRCGEMALWVSARKRCFT